MTISPNNSHFFLNLNQDSFWNYDEFIKFLVEHQGTPITVDTREEGICCCASGIYQLLETFNYTDVTIITTNPIEFHPTYKIIKLPNQWMNNTSAVPQEFHTWNQSKIFGCFYNRPSWYRIGLGAFLYAHHRGRSLINFRADPHKIDQHDRFDLNNLLINSPDSIIDFVELLPNLPLIINQQETFAVGKSADVYENQLKEFYQDFFIELVAETWTDGQTFFPTEKTTRPINFKKPFIVYGSQDYLCYIRQMGFKTFYEFWNEDYDGFSGVNRYVKILELIDSLSKKSMQELESMYHAMGEILDHNYRLLIERKFTTQITKIID